MNVTDSQPQNMNIVFLYDPVEVNKIPLDPIKTSTKFDLISLFPDQLMGGVVALGSSQLKAKITIQSNRLEFSDEQHGVPFDKRTREELWNVLRSMQNFSVQAFGINFFLQVTPEHDKGSVGFIAENYLKNTVELAQALSQPILSASARLILGTPDHYRDLRLTPLEIGSKSFQFQYHLHQETRIADLGKLVQTIDHAIVASWKECQEWLTKLP